MVKSLSERELFCLNRHFAIVQLLILLMRRVGCMGSNVAASGRPNGRTGASCVKFTKAPS